MAFSHFLLSWLSNTYTRPERWLFGYLLAYLAVGYVVLRLATGQIQYALYIGFIYKIALPIFVLMVCWRAAYIMAKIRPINLFSYFYQEIKTHLLNTNVLAKGIPTFLFISIFLSMFTSLKGAMPLIASYEWDALLAELDRQLHFGIDPWRLLADFLHYPWVTYVINVSYNVWMFAVFTILIWQTFDFRQPNLRIQFLITFVLTWSILGNVFAYALASGGPAFFSHFVGTDVANPFSAQMQYLAAASEVHDIWALTTQEVLLEKFTSQELSLGAGISAMPSLHVAMTTLLALLAMRTHRVFGWVMLSYLALIQIGSVHLAWHYAIDGYLSILSTILMWKGVGYLISKLSSEQFPLVTPRG